VCFVCAVSIETPSVCFTGSKQAPQASCDAGDGWIPLRWTLMLMSGWAIIQLGVWTSAQLGAYRHQGVSRFTGMLQCGLGVTGAATRSPLCDIEKGWDTGSHLASAWARPRRAPREVGKQQSRPHHLCELT